MRTGVLTARQTGFMDGRRRLAASLAISALMHALALMTPVGYRLPLPTGGKRAEILTVRLAYSSAGFALSETTATLSPDRPNSPAIEGTASIAGAAAGIPPADAVLSPLQGRYFTNDEVGIRAVPVATPPLVIPERAYAERIRGKVRLRVYINEQGAIDAIDVVAAEPLGVFEETAINAVAATRFKPAQLFGRKVKTVKELEIDFDPYETISSP